MSFWKNMILWEKKQIKFRWEKTETTIFVNIKKLLPRKTYLEVVGQQQKRKEQFSKDLLYQMNIYLKHVSNQIVIRVRKVYLSEDNCHFCKTNCDHCHNYVKWNN